MLKKVSACFVASCVMAGVAVAEGAPQPEKMSKEAIAGAIFSDPRLQLHTYESELGPYDTEDVETFLSSDRKFDSGMYKSGPVRMTLDPYGVDEFMYFLEGGVTLTSADGTVTEIKAGDAVTIPKEWKGVWETKGYMKIYVIYSSDAPIE